MDEKLLLLLAGGLVGVLGTLATQSIGARFKRREQLLDLREAWAGEAIKTFRAAWQGGENQTISLHTPLELMMRDRASAEAMYWWLSGRLFMRWTQAKDHRAALAAAGLVDGLQPGDWEDYNASARMAQQTEKILIAWSQGDWRWPSTRLRRLRARDNRAL